MHCIDGFLENSTKVITTITKGPAFFERFNLVHTWMLKNLRNTNKQAPTKWDVFISNTIKSQLHDTEVHEFLTAIDQLPPALKRNLGGLHEIIGLYLH